MGIRDSDKRQKAGSSDQESFFAVLAKRSPGAIEPARGLLDWAKENMPYVYLSRGARSGSFFPGLQLGSNWQGAFAVWTYGRLELLYRLNDEAGLDIPEDRIDFQPSTRRRPRHLCGSTKTQGATRRLRLERC